MGGGAKYVGGFIYLLPGVAAGSGWGGVGNINGGNAFTKEIHIEGIAIPNNELAADPRFLETSISVEAVDQFKIATNGAPAMYQGQGVENYVVKSGTNAIHGSAYEYFRNNVLDARTFFNNTVAPRHHNQFGASIGGPIKKDRIFFFGTYDGYPVRTGAAVAFRTVPSVAMRSGDFSQLPVQIFDPAATSCAGGGCARSPFAGNRIPASRLSGVARALHGSLPEPKSSDLVNNFWDTGSSGTDQNNWTVKTDFNLTGRHRMYVLHNHGKRELAALVAGNRLPLPYADFRVSADNVDIDQISHSFVVSPSILNQFFLWLQPQFRPADESNATAREGVCPERRY